MTHRNPSYLILRNGIYYFQMRSPTKQQGSRQSLIRRSTRTGNRNEALKIARLLWSKVMTESHEEKTERIEKELYQHDKKMALGRELYENYTACAGNSYHKDLLTDSWSDIDYEMMYYYDEHREKNSNTLPAQKVKKHKQKKMSAYLKQYIKTRRASVNAPKDASLVKAFKQIRCMIDMINNPVSSEITPELIEEKFSNKIHMLPAKWSGKSMYKNKDGKSKRVDEIIEIADRCKDDNRLSGKTISDYVGSVRAFLKWCIDREYINKKAIFGLDSFNGFQGKPKRKVLPFSAGEIKKIYESESYKTGKIMRKPVQYWAPLLGIFTGARLGEIAQLHKEDIKKEAETGLWYIEILDEGERNIKTESSKRRVPISQNLLDLGFLNFVHSAKLKKPLFPEQAPKAKDSWGEPVGRWFNRTYIKQCGIEKNKNEQKSFHCLRHSIITEMQRKHIHANLARAITGHIYVSDAHSQYEHGFLLSQKKEALDQITFDIDLSVIKPWPQR